MLLNVLSCSSALWKSPIIWQSAVLVTRTMNKHQICFSICCHGHQHYEFQQQCAIQSAVMVISTMKFTKNLLSWPSALWNSPMIFLSICFHGDGHWHYEINQKSAIQSAVKAISTMKFINNFLSICCHGYQHYEIHQNLLSWQHSKNSCTFYITNSNKIRPKVDFEIIFSCWQFWICQPFFFNLMAESLKF